MIRIFRVATLIFCLMGLMMIVSKPGDALESAAEPGQFEAPARSDQFTVTALEDVEQLTVNQRGDEKVQSGSREGWVRVIVELDTPPLVALRTQQREPIALDSAESDAIRESILEGQNEILTQIDGGRGVISAEYRYSTVFNGFSIDVPLDQVNDLTAIDGIKRIYPQKTYELQMDASLQQINANTAWQQVGGANNAGKGIKIAVIDSGINPTNPLFSGTDFNAPAGFPKGDCVVLGTAYCSGKVIAARWYGENGGVPAGSINLEEASPRDVLGHGSHVAGIAAGNFGTSGTFADQGDGIVEVISGVAPGAWLMVYKACWNGASCPGDGLLMAFDDAVNDGADIINNSWGGGPGDDPADSPFKTAIENAVAAGVTVIFAAGNDGGDANTIGCPACVEETIAVANVLTNRVHANRVDLLAPGSSTQTVDIRIAVPARESPQPSGLTNRPIVYAGSISASNSDACASFGGTFVGSPIILAHRGNCAFSTKVNNVQNAGGVALLLINNIAGPPTNFSVNNAIGIPSFMFSQVDGTAILNAVLAQSSPRVTINSQSRLTNNAWKDLMATRSSRGPNGNPSILKPDIAAPGSVILSAWTSAFGGTGFGMTSGTSMAAPHIAGAAAILLQSNPSWTPQQLKSTLMNSAVRDGINKELGSPAADAFDIGAGRLDLARMIGSGATFANASYANPDCRARCSFNNVLTNETDQSVTWTASVEDPDGTNITVVPSTITLAAGASASFVAHIDVDADASNDWAFGGIEWTASGQTDVSTAWLPLAVIPSPGVVTAAFEKSAETPTPLQVGDTFTYTLRLQNPISTTNSFLITDTLPAGLTFLSNVGTPSVSYNATTRDVTASANNLPPALSISAGDYGGYMELLTLNPNLQPFACEGLCDDDWFSVPGLDLQFMGEQFDTIYVSSNGVVSLKPFTNSANTPQRFPDSAEPNHLIAPLWSDYDLMGTDGDTVGGGKIYGAQVSNASGTIWNVIEWKDAEHYGRPEVVHSFQLWIQRGTDNMWFTYGRLDGLASYAASVGVEDASGGIGDTWFHKATLGAQNEGVLPTTNDDLFVDMGTALEYKFTVQADHGVFIDNVAFAEGGGQRLVASNRVRIGEQVFLPIVVKP